MEPVDPKQIPEDSMFVCFSGVIESGYVLKMHLYFSFFVNLLLLSIQFYSIVSR